MKRCPIAAARALASRWAKPHALSRPFSYSKSRPSSSAALLRTTISAALS